MKKSMAFNSSLLCRSSQRFLPPYNNILVLLDRSIQIKLNNLDTVASVTSISTTTKVSDVSCVTLTVVK